MKPEELRFKCVSPGLADEIRLRTVLYKAGLAPLTTARDEPFIKVVPGHMHTSESASEFCKWGAPIMTIKDAIDLISKVEIPIPAPEFDIKVSDLVLVRCREGETWKARHFEYAAHSSFGLTSGEYREQMYPYDEDMHLDNITPDGWWEARDGKPVWRTKK